jgi:hypothetical protein
MEEEHHGTDHAQERPINISLAESRSQEVGFSEFAKIIPEKNNGADQQH